MPDIGSTSQAPRTLVDKVKSIRSCCVSWEQSIIDLKKCEEFQQEQQFPNQHSEAIANIMLAYRHMEDARMRLGKVLQAWDGGESIYDKPKQ